MLGITTADAIAFGSLCAALLAAYAGIASGDKAKKAQPPNLAFSAIAGSIVDSQALAGLTSAVARVATVMENWAAQEKEEDQFDRLLRHLEEREEVRAGQPISSRKQRRFSPLRRQ